MSLLHPVSGDDSINALAEGEEEEEEESDAVAPPIPPRPEVSQSASVNGRKSNASGSLDNSKEIEVSQDAANGNDGKSGSVVSEKNATEDGTVVGRTNSEKNRERQRRPLPPLPGRLLPAEGMNLIVIV